MDKRKEIILPGFSEMMRCQSLNFVPAAILSQLETGTNNYTFIINLPGKPNLVLQCPEAIAPIVLYGIDLPDGPILKCNAKRIKVLST